jgi:predicted GNAT superfamily acetyltransferase
MQTTECYGGVTLGAFVDGRLVGYSYALAGRDAGRAFLLSCGLAVDRAYASRGVGEALKREQARRALEAGYDLIRWTTNPLASAPLHLYLSKLGARLVRYRRDMYAGTRSGAYPDEVEIDWELGEARPAPDGPAPPLLTARGLDANELRTLRRGAYTVEIPWDRAALLERSPGRAREWQAAVRKAMEALLGAGFAGTALIADRERRRSRVRFDRGSG